MKSVISKQLTLVLLLVLYYTTCSKLKINKNLKKSSDHNYKSFRVKVTGKSINIYENNEACLNDCGGKMTLNRCVPIKSSPEISKTLESLHAQFTPLNYLCFKAGWYDSDPSLGIPNIFDEGTRGKVEPLSIWGVFFKNYPVCDALCGGLYYRECALVQETDDTYVCAYNSDYLDETD